MRELYEKLAGWNPNRTRLVASALVVVLVGVVAIYVVLPEYLAWQRGGLTDAGVEIEVASYDESAETMQLVVERGAYTDGETVAVYVRSRGEDGSEHDVTMTTPDSPDSAAGVWAPTEQGGVTTFPLREGATVTLVSDGTDADGDGTDGIEPSETVVIVEDLHGQSTTVTTHLFDVSDALAAENATG